MSKRIYAALLSSAFMVFGTGAMAATQSNASQGSSQQQQKPTSNEQANHQSASGQNGQANGQEGQTNGKNGKSTSPMVISKLQKSQILASSLEGMAVKNGSKKNAKEIGTVGDLIIGKKSHKVEGIIVDIGGFLGIGTKKVGITTGAIKGFNDQKKTVVVAVTKKELSNAPGFKNKAEQKQKKKQQQEKQKQHQQQGQSQSQSGGSGSNGNSGSGSSNSGSGSSNSGSGSSNSGSSSSKSSG